MVPRKFNKTYIKEISTNSGLWKAKPWIAIPRAMIVPILEIDKILSKGVGPFAALIIQRTIAIARILSAAKKITYQDL